MRKFNAKNLRREVQKQLKELRGGVGRKTVGNGLKVKGYGLTVSDEGLAVTGEVVVGYPLRPSGKPSALLWGDKYPSSQPMLLSHRPP